MFARLARYRRFSLTTMLLVVTVLSLYLGREWRKAEERRIALAWIVAHDMSSGDRKLCEISLPTGETTSWLERLLERESTIHPSPRTFVSGYLPEELARIRSAFPQAQIHEWSDELTRALPIDWKQTLTVDGARQARAKAAGDLWDALQRTNWTPTDPEVEYLDFYLASCGLRDVEVTLATSRDERLAARRNHVERLQQHYLQRNALYQVGAAGGEAHREAQARLGWLEAVLELRTDEQGPDPPDDKIKGAPVTPQTKASGVTDGTTEVARIATATMQEIHRMRSEVAERLWVALHTNFGGPAPYGHRDRYFGSCQMRDAELALAASQVDRIAARRRHLEHLQRSYDRCRVLYDVNALGGEPHIEAQLRERCYEALCELQEEEGRK